MAFQVAVCGPSYCTDQDKADAHRVGQLLAEAGVVVICGGGVGVMGAVAAGVRSRDGLVVGIRPGDSRADASPDLSVTLVTNMGEARNAIIVWSADAVIAIGGSWGTLSEIALAKFLQSVQVGSDDEDRWLGTAENNSSEGALGGNCIQMLVKLRERCAVEPAEKIALQFHDGLRTWDVRPQVEHRRPAGTKARPLVERRQKAGLPVFDAVDG